MLRIIIESLKLTQVLVILVLLLLFYNKWILKRWKLWVAASKINGPFAFPILGTAHKFWSVRTTEDFLIEVENLYKDYGSVVQSWIGPYLVICCYKPQDLEIILNSNKCIDKSMIYHHMLYFSPNSIGGASGDLWKKDRRIMGSILNNKLMDSFADKMSENAENLVAITRDIVNTKCYNNNTGLYKLAENSLMELYFDTLLGIPGNSINCMEFTKIYVQIIGCISTVLMKLWTYFDPILTITNLGKERKELLVKCQKITNQIIEAKRKSITETDTNSIKTKDLLESLIKEHKFSNEQLRDEITFYAAAVIDTINTSVNYTLMCLGMFPEIQQNVYQEVTLAIGNNKNITIDHLLEFEYLERVILETLRLFPVAQNISREVNEGFQISNGIVIPAGAILLLSISVAHMDPEHWPDPWKFDPDRFLYEETIKRHPYAFLAFSAGIRNCLGYKFAKMNIKCYIASIIREFAVECDYKCLTQVRQEMNLTNKPVQGYKFRLVRRT